MGLLIGLLFSALAGYVGSTLMGMKGPWYQYVLLGLAGGLVGGLAFSLIGIGANNIIGQAIISALGACIVIYLYRMLKK